MELHVRLDQLVAVSLQLTLHTIHAVDVHRSGMKMPSVALFVRLDGIFTPVRWTSTALCIEALREQDQG